MIKQTLNPKNWLPQAAALSVAVLIYVVYNLLDSLIIGGANAVFMAVMGIPYVGLVSFIVAVTNLIPTFGTTIGGAAGVLTAIPAVAIPDFLYTDYILPRLEARKQEPVT